MVDFLVQFFSRFHDVIREVIVLSNDEPINLGVSRPKHSSLDYWAVGTFKQI